MKTIALKSAKGGVGKSTICLNLAVCFAKDGFVTACLDYDEQLSLVDILEERRLDQSLAPIFFHSAGSSDELVQKHKLAEEGGADIFLVDCPPDLHTPLPIPVDKMLVPVTASPIDVRTLKHLFRLEPHLVDTNYEIVFNKVTPPRRGTDNFTYKSIREVTTEMYPFARLSDHYICHRQSFMDLTFWGKGVCDKKEDKKACEEITRLYEYLRHELVGEVSEKVAGHG